MVIIMFFFLLVCFYVLFRNFLTFRYGTYWIDVIHRYNIHCINSRDLSSTMDYDDTMVKYTDYLFNLFEFNRDAMILDAHKLELLKEFMLLKDFTMEGE